MSPAEIFDLAVYAAALERARLKLEEQIHHHPDSDQIRWRLVAELEAISWAEVRLREQAKTAEAMEAVRGLLAAAEQSMLGHPYAHHFHDACGSECCVTRARALLRIPTKGSP